MSMIDRINSFFARHLELLRILTLLLLLILPFFLYYGALKDIAELVNFLFIGVIISMLLALKTG